MPPARLVPGPIDGLPRRPVPERPWDVSLDQVTSAGICDYLLDGKDLLTVDRVAGEQALAVFPSLRASVRENRAFARRAVAYIAQLGFRTFLDVGIGFPDRPPLHEVIQDITPDTRVIYVDNDLRVLLHARALLKGRATQRIEYLDADLRDPWPLVRRIEDEAFCYPDQPIALSLTGILHLLPDADDPHAIVAELRAALPAGSALILSHLTADAAPDQVAALATTWQDAGLTIQPRSRDEIARFTAGLDLLGTGLTSCHRWQPPGTRPSRRTTRDAQVSCYATVART
ncbi:SAM-dependent methyltransferase [Pseudofrankia sp. DC12]|uniref:SAM-dependent methyltransferase n=1 Tax=Pseudofrankia sp. DC12 TaxID=683315 RepID=UPI00069821D8|nr:SAM-dependent methyltransferase [Pseudofrankia sp. DC12]